MLPEQLRETLAATLGTQIQDAKPLGGGCIAQATRLDTTDGPYFLKWGAADVAQTFPAEAAGLAALRAAGSPLLVPTVLAQAPPRARVPGYLVTTWIDTAPPTCEAWTRFGGDLAHLHRHTADRYGFDQDNFAGRTPQHNPWHAHWPTFFREARLAPQARLARETGRWETGWDGLLANLYAELDNLLPATPPASMLHGDLWSGNVLFTPRGQAALFDPAAYYGDRETDYAMTELFGGFDPCFYRAYQAAWPLASGYTERRAVYHLYHLLNHLNLFGRSYAGSVASILRRFG